VALAAQAAQAAPHAVSEAHLHNAEPGEAPLPAVLAAVVLAALVAAAPLWVTVGLALVAIVLEMEAKVHSE